MTMNPDPWDDGIAVVGVALRFPGSSSADQYWDNLLTGQDSIVRTAGARPSAWQNPLGVPGNARFVTAYGAIANPMEFDRTRFGMSATEALLTDPQQRLLLEVTDEALNTGNVDRRGGGRISVFAGSGPSDYEGLLRQELSGRPGVDDAAVDLATARDYCAGRLAYRLDLRGPAVNVLSACSTALMAVHLGCRSLLSHESDVAVAAVSSVRVPEHEGYWAVPGSISSSDGFCRPFDRRASGTVPGDGVGAVVLKRLGDALADRDLVLAVIRGSAANNDGRKPGFAGVSSRAQTELVLDALRAGGLTPDDVSYVEAHGTGTRLGDAVEWAALQRVFGRNRSAVHVGAVKANLGHLRESAGMAGLVKAVMSLRHRTLAPTANFTALPSDLRVDCSPLKPLDEGTEWKSVGREPLRAGVSAFGLGGTNCHVVLEEAPPRNPAERTGRGLVLLSSHGPETLERDTAAVRDLLAADPMAAGDIAHTTRVRSATAPFRRFALVTEEEAEQALDERVLRRQTHRLADADPRIAFVFPGIGSEYVGMGARLRQENPVFRTHLDGLVERALAVCGVDLAPVFREEAAPERATAPAGIDFGRFLGGDTDRGRDRDHPLRALPTAHLSLFCVEYALARTLMDLGVRPAALIGHSLGEWAAATVSGIFSADDALRLVARRAELIESVGEGVTAAVVADAAAVAEHLVPGVSLAADNSPNNCSVSGTEAGMRQVLDRLREAGYVTRRLGTRNAFHSPQLHEVGDRLSELVDAVTCRAPEVPIVSNVTGDWMPPEAPSAEYWKEHLVSPVLLRQGLRTLLDRHTVVVEVGPGTMRPWVMQAGPEAACVRTVRNSYENLRDDDVLLRALGELWLRGAAPDWERIRSGGPRDRVALPAPALERETHDPRNPAAPAPGGAARAGESGPARSTEGAGTTDDLETRLAEMWSALLGVGEVRPEDHFFHLGGDSLLGRHLIAMISDLTGEDVPGRVVFRSGTLGGMAEAVRQWISGEGREGEDNHE